MKPKISVITITYNSEKYLERTIKSIREQEYENLEYIIVDGGSGDGTLEIIQKYDEVVNKWISEPDEGISDAFNKGISMASGDVIGIINSDDGLLPGALKAIADAYDERIDVYRGNVMLWKEDTNTQVIEIPSMFFKTDGTSKVSHQSTFISKSAYERFGQYDKKLKYAMDYDLLLRFQGQKAVFQYIDATLAFYTLGGLTFNSNMKERQKELETIFVSHGASKMEILKYRIVQLIKNVTNRILGKDLAMKLRNGLLKRIG